MLLASIFLSCTLILPQGDIKIEPRVNCEQVFLALKEQKAIQQKLTTWYERCARKHRSVDRCLFLYDHMLTHQELLRYYGSQFRMECSEL